MYMQDYLCVICNGFHKSMLKVTKKNIVLENRSHKVAERLLFNFISLQKSMDCMMIFNMYFIACLKKKNYGIGLSIEKKHGARK